MAFQRAYSCQVGASVDSAPSNSSDAIDVSNLRLKFKVKKDLTPIPNHAELTIYNLSHDTRSLLETAKVLPVSLAAGYVDEGISQIYLGDLRQGETKKKGPDVLTKMDTDDKGKKLQTLRINCPVGPGLSVENAIRQMLAALNPSDNTQLGAVIGEGNLKTMMNQLKTLGVTSIYPNGGVLSGYVVRQLTDLCRSVGMKWCIDDGCLYFVFDKITDSGQVVNLSSTSGLIGSPVVDNEGTLTANVIMIPDIKPGVIVHMDAVDLKGYFRLSKCEYRGDTHSEEGEHWGIKINGKAVG